MIHPNVKLQATVAKPVDACSPLVNNVKGKAVLVRRGGCPFVKKAEEIQAAGGRVMVVGNHQPFLTRMVSVALLFFPDTLFFEEHVDCYSCN
jgi:PA domain